MLATVVAGMRGGGICRAGRLSALGATAYGCLFERAVRAAIAP